MIIFIINEAVGWFFNQSIYVSVYKRSVKVQIEVVLYEGFAKNLTNRCRARTSECLTFLLHR